MFQVAAVLASLPLTLRVDPLRLRLPRPCFCFRRLDILQTMAVIRQILQDTTAETADTQSQAAPQAAAHATSPSSSTDAPATSSANSSEAAVDPDGDQDPPSSSSNNGRILLRAVVEVASILPSNGRLATLNQGYSVGAWTALLASHGFDVTTVHVLSWKKDMGLLKRDKDSSRQLAKTLFQQAGAPQDELLRWGASSTAAVDCC